MPLINRLQRRLGWLAIPNLTIYLIVGQAFLYVANYLPQGISLDRIQLDVGRVLDGEVWRLVTFLFVPPNVVLIFVIFYFMLLHTFGTALELHWGVFRYNLFLLTGYLANVGAAFIAWYLFQRNAPPGVDVLAGASIDANNGFLYGTIFLAFARLYPDFIITIFFILPVRIKWLALLAWCGYILTFAVGDGMTQMLVLASVANYLLFFGREHWREVRYMRRRQSYNIKAKKAIKPPKHECRVCGLSSDDAPARTQFRYCSKCAGQTCYCPDHIRNHEHVTAETPAAS